MSKYCWVVEEYSQQENMGVFTTKKAAIAAARKHFRGDLRLRKLSNLQYELIDKNNIDDGYGGRECSINRFAMNVMY